jgi:hypothetical protein
MKRCCFLMLVLFFASSAPAQTLDKVEPSNKVRPALLPKPVGVAKQVAATARDLVTFRDKRWSLLTLAQIGAAAADAKTSLNNLHDCATCEEKGISRFFVGGRPDAHKYVIAGMIEIGVEAVAAHYLGNHGPKQKWYWRYIRTLPQSISLFGHARAANYNAGLPLQCYAPGAHC